VSDRLLVCNRPSVRIRPAIRPERPPAATVFVDIAVPSTYSYCRVRGPLEVDLTRTGTHLQSWVTCTSSTVRHRAMAVKPKESTSNATLNGSCHTTPHSHRSIDRRLREYGSLETNKRTAARPRTVRTPDLEETVSDTIEEKPSSSTRTSARDLSPLTLTFCCNS
jgi:hypothetical protein